MQALCTAAHTPRWLICTGCGQQADLAGGDRASAVGSRPSRSTFRIRPHKASPGAPKWFSPDGQVEKRLGSSPCARSQRVSREFPGRRVLYTFTSMEVKLYTTRARTRPAPGPPRLSPVSPKHAARDLLSCVYDARTLLKLTWGVVNDRVSLVSS